MTKPAFQLLGFASPLPRGRSAALTACRMQWGAFNAALRRAGLTQSIEWNKFAVTYKSDAGYWYFTGIPLPGEANGAPLPDGFERREIPALRWQVYEHRGGLGSIFDTYAAIYRSGPAGSGPRCEGGPLLHLERYDRRFAWDSPESLLEIWVPDALQSFAQHSPLW